MKKEDIEKYIAGLSPELQEKARACKNIGEIRKLMAENDIELPADALEAVSGGCSASSTIFNRGDLINSAKCGDCGGMLRYYDMLYGGFCEYVVRMYCNNPNCRSYDNELWYIKVAEPGMYPFGHPYRWHEGV